MDSTAWLRLLAALRDVEAVARALLPSISRDWTSDGDATARQHRPCTLQHAVRGQVRANAAVTSITFPWPAPALPRSHCARLLAAGRATGGAPVHVWRQLPGTQSIDVQRLGVLDDASQQIVHCGGGAHAMTLALGPASPPAARTPMACNAAAVRHQCRRASPAFLCPLLPCTTPGLACIIVDFHHGHAEQPALPRLLPCEAEQLVQGAAVDACASRGGQDVRRSSSSRARRLMPAQADGGQATSSSRLQPPQAVLGLTEGPAAGGRTSRAGGPWLREHAAEPLQQMNAKPPPARHGSPLLPFPPLQLGQHLAALAAPAW